MDSKTLTVVPMITYQHLILTLMESLMFDDACPLEPETYNQFQDTDGCPDSTG